MKKLLLAVSLSALFLAGACQKSPEPPKPAPTPAPEVVAPPPDMSVGQSCSKDCGKKGKAEITCATGETPECACAPALMARCLPPAKP